MRKTSHGPFPLKIVAICAVVVAIDGFDVQAISYVAPELAARLNIARNALGPLFASGLFGMMAGALFFGPVADRFGRKPILVACRLMFGVCSLLTATANSLQSIFIFQLITGFGLGGAMPNAIALTSESAPKAYRATAVTVMFCGFSLGAAMGGFVAAGLITRFGWQTVFVVGGALPCLTAILLLALLPESAGFLREKQHPAGASVLSSRACSTVFLTSRSSRTTWAA